MARSGILHIGIPKTATTSCQEALFAKRDRLLERHRTFYPSVAPSHNSMLTMMFMDDPRAHVAARSKGIATREEAEALRRDCFARMEADLAGASWDRVVLSSEGLSTLPVGSLERLRGWLAGIADDWTVLLWSRHPVSYVTSDIQQLVKAGETLEALLGAPPFPDMRTRVSNAFQAFGRENLRFAAFEEARAEPGGPVAAFCRRLGLPEETAMAVAASATPRNESMSMMATLVLSSLNRQRPRFVDGRPNPQRRPRDVQAIQRIEGERFRLSAEAERELRRRSRGDVAWLNATFGTELYLDVFSEAEDGRSEPARYAPEVVDSLALLLSDLVNRGEARAAEPKPEAPRPWWRRRSA